MLIIMSSLYVYVLELSNNNFYIDQTDNITDIVSNNIHPEKGLEWISIHAPVGIKEIVQTIDPFDEDKIVIKYMSMYGIQNVRGGSFCEVELSENTIDIIRKMIFNATNKCDVVHTHVNAVNGNIVDDNVSQEKQIVIPESVDSQLILKDILDGSKCDECGHAGKRKMYNSTFSDVDRLFYDICRNNIIYNRRGIGGKNIVNGHLVDCPQNKKIIYFFIGSQLNDYLLTLCQQNKSYFYEIYVEKYKIAIMFHLSKKYYVKYGVVTIINKYTEIIDVIIRAFQIRKTITYTDLGYDIHLFTNDPNHDFEKYKYVQ